MKYSSFDAAYHSVLDTIFETGSIASPRNRTSKELIGYQYILTNPRNRIVFNSLRNVNIFYCIGNFLWVMSQSNDLDFISYYNPKGHMFSDDGKILRGAYGKRIFDFDGVNQYHQCIKELKTDPDSRRAIIHIHLPQHDWAGSIDTPCTADFQLLIRDNKLTMINHMRSQSAAMVMPYDVFLMTMIQEFMANELGVEVGEFIHFSSSLHYYMEEEKFVIDIIKSRPKDDDVVSMGKMPKTSIFELRKLLEFEKNIRMNYSDKIDWISMLNYYKLDYYWNQIGYALIVYAMFKNAVCEDKIIKFIDDNLNGALFSKAYDFIARY